MAKVTLQDIARQAGVGTATVERVLNGRGGVATETVERVIVAALALNYPKRLPEKHRGVIRIEVILVRPETTFFARLSRAFERIAATLDRSVQVHRTFLEEGNPLAIAEKIKAPDLRRSGLILAVPEHPAIRAALTEVRGIGTPIVQIVTPMAGLDADYVGIDNDAAGRMAGLLMAGLQPNAGDVIVMCHSEVYAVHRQRVRGFSDFLSRQQGARLIFRRASFTHDSPVEASEQLFRALEDYPGLVGLYNVGAANSTLSDVLRRHPHGRNVCFIGHELTEGSTAALKDGTMAAVIDQAPETQARRSLDLILSRLGLLDQAVDLTPIRFITITPENV